MSSIWTLKSGAGSSLRKGHPWVFKQEVANIPRNFINGSAVEIRDDKGRFIARGYGNPLSQIAFRAITWNESERDFFTPSFLENRLLAAWKKRFELKFNNSFRLCFAEADLLPGLVIDRYKIQDGSKQVLSIQISTAGLHRWLASDAGLFARVAKIAFEKGWSDVSADNTAILFRNDISVRKIEGLEVEEPRIIQIPRSIDLRQVDILVDAFQSEKPIAMTVDLLEGQKTGFFLDQRQNIFNFLNVLSESPILNLNRPLKVLDLCCYVGHWSTQISTFLKAKNLTGEFTLVDVSNQALKLAKINAERAGGGLVIVKKLDVLKELSECGSGFDIIIADPPAFIKSKKDIPNGTRAYLKLNTNAFEMCQKNGYVISCSCSGNFTEALFVETLKKAIAKVESTRPEMKWNEVASGGHSEDHPILPTFNESYYLKMKVHQNISF